MEIILLERIEKLGQMGDLVNVNKNSHLDRAYEPLGRQYVEAAL